MHQGSEKFLEASGSDLVQVTLGILQLLSQVLTHLVVLLPLGLVVSESTRDITLLSQCFDYIFSIIFVYNNAVDLILIFVL